MANWQPILANEYIQLTPLQQSDWDVLYAVASDQLIWEQHPESNRYQKAVFALFLEKAITDGALLITHKPSGAVIGSTRFYDEKPSQSIAIGYTFLSRSYWGNGTNLWVKKLQLDYAFQFVPKVVFHVGSTNWRSQKAVAKLGAVPVQQILFERPNGSQTPSIEFAMTKEVWLSQQGL